MQQKNNRGKDRDPLEVFVDAMSKAYAIRGTASLSPGWEQRVMCSIERQYENSSPWDEWLSSLVFLRIGFAVLAMTLLVHSVVGVDSLESIDYTNAILQIDPFYVGSDLNG